jgi:hypothetical protein
MTNFKIILFISIVLSIAFGFTLNWSMGIDYSAATASMMPLGIVMIMGILALSTWGGVLGAWLDYKEESN